MNDTGEPPKQLRRQRHTSIPGEPQEKLNGDICARRIQGMLDELRPLLAANTVSNLLGRLNDTKRPEQRL
jgi:hypothetical protein